MGSPLLLFGEKSFEKLSLRDSLGDGVAVVV